MGIPNEENQITEKEALELTNKILSQLGINIEENGEEIPLSYIQEFYEKFNEDLDNQYQAVSILYALKNKGVPLKYMEAVFFFHLSSEYNIDESINEVLQTIENFPDYYGFDELKLDKEDMQDIIKINMVYQANLEQAYYLDRTMKLYGLNSVEEYLKIQEIIRDTGINITEAIYFYKNKDEILKQYSQNFQDNSIENKADLLYNSFINLPIAVPEDREDQVILFGQLYQFMLEQCFNFNMSQIEIRDITIKVFHHFQISEDMYNEITNQTLLESSLEI